ncbi:MAG: MFS transporter [Xanthomonadales bacterium]|nr:MFS transporter [Xanthomonadales bacterium]
MIPTERKALFYTAVIALGGFLFGFDAAVISGVVGFVTPEFGLNEWWVGAVVSAPSFAAIIAALTVGPIADYVGRKKVMLTLALLYTISAVASAFAPDAVTLVAARFIGGLAFGTLMLAPIYIAEIAPARLRGRMVSVNQLNIVIGFSAAYFANYFILGASQSGSEFAASIGLDQYAWRWMLGLEALPAALYFLFMLFVPESPRWLVLEGHAEKARAIMARITPADEIEDLLASIRESAQQATHNLAAKIRDMFRPELRMVLIVGLIAGIAQQSSGINVVYFYAPTIFEQSGVGTNAAFAQATYIGLVNIGFTVLAMMLVDKLGRKPLMIAGLLGVAISMSVSSYGFYSAHYELPMESATALMASENIEGLDRIAGIRYEDDVSFKAAAYEAIGKDVMKANEAVILQSSIHMNSTVVLVGILGFVASFAFSLGPVMWVLFSEIFPNRIRGVCMAFMGVVNSGVSWFIQFIFPYELATLGSAGTFLVFAVFAAIFMVLLMWLMPETRGRSLEELEKELSRA